MICRSPGTVVFVSVMVKAITKIPSCKHIILVFSELNSRYQIPTWLRMAG